MKILILLLALSIGAIAQDFLKGNTYVVVESNHSWFRHGFSEKFVDTSFVEEDLDVHDGLDIISYFYKLTYKKEGGKIFAFVQMSNSIRMNANITWRETKEKAELVKTKGGFNLLFENGKKVKFLKIEHFII